MDWSTIIMGAATGALSTYAIVRLDRSRDSQVRVGNAEIAAAEVKIRVDQASIDIHELEQRMVAAECKIAALEATHGD